MSLNVSGECRTQESWSTAALQDAVKRAIKDAQTSPLPRALSVDKVFDPLVRAIQRDHYRHMPQSSFPVSSELLVLDLSLNYMMFSKGDLAAGVTEKELIMIALFEALQRDEICEDEVVGLAKRLITPSFQAEIERPSKIDLLKHRVEGYNLSSSRQELNSSISQEVFHSTLPRLHLFEVTDSHTSFPSLDSSATAYFSEDQVHSNAVPISVSRISHPAQHFLPNILIIPAESQVLSPIHVAGKASVLLTSTSKSPILGPSRSPNLPSTPSPNVISSKDLRIKKQYIVSSRRSNMANKENIPPMHRH
ncbi:hypothetical protein C0992_006009 [Termitomyces sp. T32_za158]|nr:hypothetical protein C0992_006009 [Termitomyces sp. T32_za158]